MFGDLHVSPYCQHLFALSDAIGFIPL